MSKYNGTAVVLWADGVLIACQKGFTFGIQQNIRDASNKESAGWEEHEDGMRSATVSVESLVSTTGLSAAGLITYITSRKSLMVEIIGLGSMWVMEADLSNISLSANMEESMGVSGSMKVKGRPFNLAAANTPNLLTDPDAGGKTYGTFTITGTKITSAICSGAAEALSNDITITAGTYRLVTFLTKNSGQLPSCVLQNVGGNISNAEAMVEGVNNISFTVASNTTGFLKIYNSSAANWSTVNMYIFKTS